MLVSKHFSALFFLFFFAVAAPLAAQSGLGDCATARVLCNKGAVVLDVLAGPGDGPAEVSATTCLDAPLAETHSAWFRWTVAESGTLELALTPLHNDDDLDFVLESAGSCACAPVPGLCASVQAPAPDAGERLSVSGVMPNPAAGGAAQIALRTTEALSGSLSVTDASGRLRSTAPLRLAPGEHVLHLDLSALEPGACWANLVLGEHRRSLRFVRQ